MRSQQEDGFQILTPSRGRHIRYPSSPVLHSGRCVRAMPRTYVYASAIEVSSMSSTFFSSMRSDVSRMHVCAHVKYNLKYMNSFTIMHAARINYNYSLI